MTDSGPVQVLAFDQLSATLAYHLWRLRQEVFVVEQGCPYPDLDGRDTEAATRHLLIEADDRPVACLRLLDDGDAARIGRVAVAPTWRSQGLADALMVAAVDLIGDRPSRLDAQTGLVRWYARFGYAVSGEEFIEDGIPHRPMARPGRRHRGT